jgi:hypothetical protein
MIAPCGRRKIRWIETIQAVNLTSPPKGKVLAMALVMHSYLPNLAGLPICLEISKFLKKNWSKTCNFGMVWWEIFLPSPRRQHFRENFFRCPFQYPKVPLEAGAPPQSFDASYAPGQSGCNIPHHKASLFINGAAKHLFQCQQDSNTNPEWSPLSTTTIYISNWS